MHLIYLQKFAIQTFEVGQSQFDPHVIKEFDYTHRLFLHSNPDGQDELMHPDGVFGTHYPF